MTITMTSKNQITIPKKLVTAMGLSEGALFEIHKTGNRIELIPLEVIEKVFSDNEYNKMEDIYQNEKHLTKPLSAKFIEKL